MKSRASILILKVNIMRRKHLIPLYFSVAVFFPLSCGEPEFSSNNPPGQKFNLNSELTLSKEVLDSAVREEGKTKNTYVKPLNVTPNASQSPNYALSSTVRATTTFRGYDVENIKDGDQNTTVGPKYSWANAHNADLDIRLPASVFMQFPVSRMIEKIEIYTSRFYEIQNYTILYKKGSTNTWNTLVTVTGNTSVHITHNLGIILDVVEIEIRCQRGPAGQTVYARLNEVEVYGTDYDLPSF
jgi:hypothetical protein